MFSTRRKPVVRESVPLPSNPFYHETGDTPQPPSYTAYQHVLEMETCPPQFLSEVQAAGLKLASSLGKIDEDLVKKVARVLGYVLIEFNQPGQYRSATDIIECNNHLDRFLLGIKYIDYVILPWKQHAAGTSPESETVIDSRPSLEIDKAYIRELSQHTNAAAPASHTEAKNLCLDRDNFTCLITGKIEMRFDDDEFYGHPAPTNAAHIFPKKLLPSPNPQTITDNTGIWAVLRRFGNGILEEEFSGEKINRPQNILTMSLSEHVMMNELLIWLEPISCVMPDRSGIGPGKHIDYTQNPSLRFDDVDWEPLSIECRVGTVFKKMLQNGYVRRIVTLQNHSDIPIRLPSIRYLTLHAACARVAHLSGAGQLVEQLVSRYEHRLAKTPVLAEDGSDWDLLIASLSNSVEAF